MGTAPIEDGFVHIRRNRIVSFGRWKDRDAAGSRGPVRDLGERVLMPGLVNAHCHFDYTMLRRTINPPKSFAAWIETINGLKRTMQDEDFVRAIHEGIAQSLKAGSTTVFNIESFPGLLPRIATPLLRVWWFMEMIDLRFPVGSLRFRLPKGWIGETALSPHAPYTASEPLYRRVAKSKQLSTTHFAESVEERAMFEKGEGKLYELLKRVGRSMEDCGRPGLLRRFLDAGLINRKTLLVHLNCLERGDAARLRGYSVVHCPRSHIYFRHPPFEWNKLRRAGVNICLGTDSLASNDSLSLFEEMRAALQLHPGLKPRDVLESVTLAPGRFMAERAALGSIRQGALADFIAIPFAGTLRDVYEAVVDHRQPVRWAMVNGSSLHD